MFTAEDSQKNGRLGKKVSNLEKNKRPNYHYIPHIIFKTEIDYEGKII